MNSYLVIITHDKHYTAYCLLFMQYAEECHFETVALSY